MKRIVAAGLVAIALVAAVSILAARRGTLGDRPEAPGRVLIGGPFTLVDGDGRTWTETAFRGAPMLVTFGYTHCPDVCPTTLQTITDALDVLGPQGEAIQPLFITVDPERDTPKVMRDYVDHFHERLIGLTGSTGQTTAAARAWRVTARKAAEDGEDYLVDHTALIYLMGPDGAYVTHFGHRSDAGSIAAKLAEYLERES